ncbi:S41 family peptidase [Desulfosarcina sp. OttesenSCG-928-A07]|nr:S41 family peptidase [Desulfosarcina sp. OttesenSCG-928-A07]
MTAKTTRRMKLWVTMVGVSVVLILGHGFYRTLSANSEPFYKGVKLLTDTIEFVQKNFVDEVDGKQLFEAATQGMLHSLDPHSALLTPDAMKEVQIDTQGEFTGIGIHITLKDSVVTVIAPIEGTPAWRAGIKAGDRIVKIDGIVAEDLTDAVKRMRGPKGTTVNLTLYREGEPEPLEMSIVRDVIPIYSVKAELLKPGYGYVWVTNFRENTSADLVEALNAMESGGTPLRGLILDLRNNPGGILHQAIEISDMFLNSGEILSVRGRDGKNNRVYYARANKVKRNYPIVVLINGGSASASEIVAGALQDHKRALILGTSSFGKGSVQTIEPIGEGYGIKLTVARYYTPSGRSIQAKGVEPDVEIKYQVVAEGKQVKDRLIKEKDLKNHLEAESPQSDEKTDPQNGKIPSAAEKSEDPPALKEFKAKHSSLERDALFSDNQVLRALDILVSYEIFKDLKNG